MVIALKESQATDDPGGERDLLAGQPVRVAAAVEVLVRGAHDDTDAAEQAADPVEHPLALDRVRLHERPLLVVERPGLLMIESGMCDLADVVQQRAELGLAPHVFAHAHLLGDAHGEVDDVLGVVAGVLVVLLEQVAQQQRGAAVGAAELDASGATRASRSPAKMRDQPDQRQDEQRRGGGVGGGDRGEQADGASSASTRYACASSASTTRGGTPAAEHGAQRLAGGVGGELGRERGHVCGPRAPLRRLGAERDEHDRGRERERGVVDGVSTGPARAGRARPGDAVTPTMHGGHDSSGTNGVGSRSSIGTKTSCVGTKLPSPTVELDAVRRRRTPRRTRARAGSRTARAGVGEERQRDDRGDGRRPRTRPRRASSRAGQRGAAGARAASSMSRSVRVDVGSGAGMVGDPSLDGCPMWSAARHADFRSMKRSRMTRAALAAAAAIAAAAALAAPAHAGVLDQVGHRLRRPGADAAVQAVAGLQPLQARRRRHVRGRHRRLDPDRRRARRRRHRDAAGQRRRLEVAAAARRLERRPRRRCASASTSRPCATSRARTAACSRR